MGDAKKLRECKDYGDVFEVVKETAKNVLGKSRAGLMLVLGDLPAQVGALHSLGTNAIVVNKAIIDALPVLVKKKEERNSIVYVFILHEYLHSLGYIDEGEVRTLTRSICEKSFGKDHLATKLALAGPWQLYPELAWIKPKDFGETAEVVKGFDKSSTSYIG